MGTFPALLGAIVLLSAGVMVVAAPFDPRVVLAGVLGAALMGAEALRRARARVDGLLGEQGEVLVGGRDGGRVRVRAGDWRARWRGRLRPGAPVRVVAVRENVLDVEPAEAP
jgi:membrane protein implicated in regulation of membrane protease activity